MVTKVQVKTNGGALVDSVTVTLDSTPTVGNLLWAYVCYLADVDYASVPPAGWTTVLDTRSGAIYLAKYARIVQSGDGTGWTWNFTYQGNPNSQANQVTIHEFAGQHATLYHNGGSVNAFSSATSASGTGVTPSVLDCFPLSAIATAGFETTAITGNTGTTFTKDVDQGAGGSDLGVAIGTLTTDTTTAVNATWSISSALSGHVAIDLIAPAAVVSATNLSTNFDERTRPRPYAPGLAR